MLSRDIVIGIDGGGTFTRVLVANLQGELLSYIKYEGGVHPQKNKTPEMNVKRGIELALEKANRSISSVAHIVAGIAGLNDKSDKKWAEAMFKFANLSGSVTLMNDAELAQFSAFLGEPGIIAVSGTGANVVGKTESGETITSRQFNCRINSSARFLSYAVIYELISGKAKEENNQLTMKILRYWGLNSVDELRQLASTNFLRYELNGMKELSNMATIVTEEAMNGNEIAKRACKDAAAELFLAIKLVASVFDAPTVKVSLIGSVANAEPVKRYLLNEMVLNQSYKQLTYYEPLLEPVFGAILYGYKALELQVNKSLAMKLRNDFRGKEI